MTRLIVVATGPVTSVQDFGRVGAQRYGLPPSGAMDRLAMAAANALVQNDLAAPVIEIGPLPMTIAIEGGDARIALVGAPRKIECGGHAVDMNRSALLSDGQTLTIGFARSGTFTYLGIAGGMRAERMFGSFSVTAGTGIGSPFPRALQPGDAIEVGSAHPGADFCIDYQMPGHDVIRVVAGPQADEFGDEIERFLDAEWQISPSSNRMGYRLKGPAIHHSRGHNIVSDGTVNGSIQVPGDGQPIVLMPDRGTTGGYPKIATVITPDLGRLAQMHAGSTFRFSEVGIIEAQAITRNYLRSIERVSDRVRSIQNADTDPGTLLGANLAGMAISALDSRTWQATIQDGRIRDMDS